VLAGSARERSGPRQGPRGVQHQLEPVGVAADRARWPDYA
jgi:hypothetical protein